MFPLRFASCGPTGVIERLRGATAIEFAIAFPVFFGLVYATLMYGFIFLVQMNLQHAAEEGTRAALNHPGILPSGTSPLEVRQSAADAAAKHQLGWLKTLPEVDVSICTVENESCSTTIEPDCANPVAYNQPPRCQIVVTITYPYAQHPVIPTLPLLGFLAPNEMQVTARTFLGQGIIQ